MKKSYLYAETAFHHQGDITYLKKLIETSSQIGLNGVKFQVLVNINELVSSYHSQYDILSSYIFSKDQWQDIFSFTKKTGLDIIMMPLDKESFNLDLRDVAYFDVHPVSYYDDVVINGIKRHDIPIIIGVGGRKIEEINTLIETLGENVKVLMTGFQSFPTNINHVKLLRIKSLANLYPGMTIGYADHSSYNDSMSIVSNEYAYLLGARVFEKHLTLDEGKKRVDFEAAIGPEKMRTIKKNLDFLGNILDSENLWEMSQAEIKYSDRQRVAIAKKAIHEGQKISTDDVVYKMIDQSGGISPDQKIIGEIAKFSIKKDDIILKSCIS